MIYMSNDRHIAYITLLVHKTTDLVYSKIDLKYKKKNEFRCVYKLKPRDNKVI